MATYQEEKKCTLMELRYAIMKVRLDNWLRPKDSRNLPCYRGHLRPQQYCLSLHALTICWKAHIQLLVFGRGETVLFHHCDLRRWIEERKSAYINTSRVSRGNDLNHSKDLPDIVVATKLLFKLKIWTSNWAKYWRLPKSPPAKPFGAMCLRTSWQDIFDLFQYAQLHTG